MNEILLSEEMVETKEKDKFDVKFQILREK